MQPYLGEIRVFGGNYAPQGWAFCNGQSLPVSDYENLYALIGNIYGGDGKNNFNLPNLNGRMPIGQGQSPNLSLRILGQAGGTEKVTLQPSQLPAHKHIVAVATNTKTAVNAASAEAILGPATTAAGKFIMYTPGSAPNLKDSPLNKQSVSTAAGGGEPHDNMMPNIGVTYIIAIDGIYPEKP